MHLGISPAENTGGLSILFVYSIWFIDNVAGYTVCELHDLDLVGRAKVSPLVKLAS